MLSFVNHDQKYLFGSFAVSKSSCVDTCPESRFNAEHCLFTLVYFFHAQKNWSAIS